MTRGPTPKPPVDEAPQAGLRVPAGLAPRGPGPSAPPRRPESIRRTSTIDATWPDGMEGVTVLEGRARDLVTAECGAATEVAEAVLRVVVDRRRRIVDIFSTPQVHGLAALVGESSMGGHRGRLAEVAADEVARATPLHLLLDDLPGATLVSGAAWQPWYGFDRYLAVKTELRTRSMTDVCSGYQRGSSALGPDGTIRWEQHRAPGRPLDAVEDDRAWHGLVDRPGVSMRRARRTDVWVTGSTIAVDAFFQDSSTLPGGGRQAIHEYQLTAAAGVDDLVLRSVTPVARVLPYHECPLAIPHTSVLVGRALGGLRTAVPRELAGVAGCTHLNDVLRSLADTPALVAVLDAAS